MRTIRMIIALSFFLFSVPARADLWQENGTITLSSGAMSWGVSFPAGDLKLETEKHSPDGRAHYYFFTSPKSRLNVSFTLEPPANCATSKDCRDTYVKNSNPLYVDPKKANSFDLNQFAVAEFLVPEIKGQRVNQMNMSAHYVKEGYWADLHLSKVLYQPKDRGLFTDFINSVSVRPVNQGGAGGEDRIVPREFKLPRRGALMLDVPQSWANLVNSESKDLPPTITLRPRRGNDFNLMITPLWSEKNQKGFNSPAKVKEMVLALAKDAAPQSVEKSLIVEEIRRDKGAAYYFFATDRAPKAGEYPFVIQGVIGIDDLLVPMSLVFRDKDSETVDIVLNLFSTARKK
jgi:hypothetical protein